MFIRFFLHVMLSAVIIFLPFLAKGPLAADEGAGEYEPRTYFDFEGGTDGWEILPEKKSVFSALAVDDSLAGSGRCSLRATAAFPGNGGLQVALNRDTSIYKRFSVQVFLPAGGPKDLRCSLFLQDAEWLWYQTGGLLLKPGAWNRVSADIIPGSFAWKPVGHKKPWGDYSRVNINTVGLKLNSNQKYSGPLYVDDFCFQAAAFPEYSVNASRIRRGSRFEITFRLPDLYRNPFDPAEIDVSAEFLAPSGRRISVPGFYYQDYDRSLVANGQGSRVEALEPDGYACWKIRFTPSEAGRYSYKIRIKDAKGERFGPQAQMLAEPAAFPGFVRLDAGSRDFRFDDGSYFYPIGYNYRSPTDTRYDTLRTSGDGSKKASAAAAAAISENEGTFSYEKNMARMAASGINFTEIWMSPWWLSLEWSAQRIGFYGAGRYNLRNAWKLDRIMDEAARRGIYVQLLLINHGQLSTFCDEEWQDHPYNKRNGGFISTPDEFFVNPRARVLTRNMLRYAVARWGSSPYVHSWNLLNEMNLVGPKSDFWQSPEITAWFAEMSSWLKEIDVNGHLVTGHFTGAFDSKIFYQEKVDYVANNAYYDISKGTLVAAINGIYRFHRRFQKPIVLSEYGGTSYGSSDANLVRDLHAGLWCGYTLPLAAAPLFWWHNLIEDENLFGVFQSLTAFQKRVGAARRNMEMLNGWRLRQQDGTALSLAGQMLASPEGMLGWFYDRSYMQSIGATTSFATFSGVRLHLPATAAGRYTAEFWDPQSGKLISSQEVEASPSSSITLPDFSRDTALFLRPLPEKGVTAAEG